MPRTRPRYSPAFREQIIALARAGRSVEELAREFEPCAQTIQAWIGRADRDDGRRADGPSSEEREEFATCAERTASCARNGTSWQRQQPGPLRAT